MDQALRVSSFEDVRRIPVQCQHLLILLDGRQNSIDLLEQVAALPCRVTALAINVGQDFDVESLKRLVSSTSVQLQLIDGREVFAEEAMLGAIRANAHQIGIAALGSALSRPIIARLALQTAQIHGCDAILHAETEGTGGGSTLDSLLSQQGYQGVFGSPFIKQPIRSDEIPASSLWCQEALVTEGALGSSSPDSLQESTQYLSLEFSSGRPVSLNGEALTLLELVERLNTLGQAYGIGCTATLRADIEGECQWHTRQTPAATLLVSAYWHLESSVLNTECLRDKLRAEQSWLRELLEGRWFAPARLEAEARLTDLAHLISGTVLYRLHPGAFDLCSICAENPLSDERPLLEPAVVTEVQGVAPVSLLV